MKYKVHANAFSSSGTVSVNTFVDKMPDVCPLCLHSCTPIELSGWINKTKLQKVFCCPRNQCQSLFIAYYNYQEGNNPPIDKRIYKFDKVEPHKFAEIPFPKIINQISPQFNTIYNEALKAEQMGLKNICGAGYRKSIEFLIKDYLINIKKEPKEKIEKTPLGNCINNHIKFENIKKCAERAVWIGNDETHYIRTWEDKDLKDLKDLIDVTLFWIESEYKTERYEMEMQEKTHKGGD